MSSSEFCWSAGPASGNEIKRKYKQRIEEPGKMMVKVIPIVLGILGTVPKG